VYITVKTFVLILSSKEPENMR